jgi:hypothetical protein
VIDIKTFPLEAIWIIQNKFCHQDNVVHMNQICNTVSVLYETYAMETCLAEKIRYHL